ncbi:helix-turn-helix domain-containing protein [Chryseobacterium daecheongense]|uniref:helix-turn-helix domain-containing protein n=1 Tax=Chryseobacterium daecheongense TaxID=192389 RepID=UPI001FD71FC6|nr:helix-turn-helix domain-containing protein [Chryseobacterium daecheongense]UOU98324.1 helix-turn-helix domain-containing protein [Chryseobacterium daecheongense]
MFLRKLLIIFTYIFCSFVYAQSSNIDRTKDDIDRQILSISKKSYSLNEKLRLYLEIYQNAEKINYTKGILESGEQMMIIYHGLGQDEKSIQQSYIIEKLALENNNHESLAKIYIQRGTALSALGFYDENYTNLEKAKQFVYKIENDNTRHYNMALLYQGLAAGYFSKKQPRQDTILKYFNKSLHEALLITDSTASVRQTEDKYDLLSYLYMNIGMIYSLFEPKNFDLAETNLQKSLLILNERKFTQVKVDKIPILNYLANFYFEQNKIEPAIKYAQHVLELELKNKNPSARVLAFGTLANIYEKLKVKDSTLKYMSLYANLTDSLAYINKKSIDHTVKTIAVEKDRLHQKNLNEYLLISCIIVAFIVLMTWYFWKRYKIKLQKRYDLIIEGLKSKDNKIPIIEDYDGAEIKNVEKTIYIPEETTAFILDKLTKFEKSEKFLKKDVSLSSLSNTFNTNPRYLSEIIKLYKNKNFNGYINSLRISYITDKLYNDVIFREYKISYLAEVCGFASREVFAVIFKKETGVSPSYFISQLKTNLEK